LFDRVALRIYCWSLIVIPSWLLIDAARRFQTNGRSDEERRRVHIAKEKAAAQYLAFWFAVLIGAWLISPTSELLAASFACIALLRLAEIGNTVLGFILDRREPLLAGSLITVALQAIQIALIFAILDHSFARDSFVQEGLRFHQAASTPFDYFYLSSTTMTTLGNHYSPETGLARWLELCTATSGVILLGVVVARAIGLSNERLDRGR